MFEIFHDLFGNLRIYILMFFTMQQILVPQPPVFCTIFWLVCSSLAVLKILYYSLLQALASRRSLCRQKGRSCHSSISRRTSSRPAYCRLLLPEEASYRLKNRVAFIHFKKKSRALLPGSRTGCESCTMQIFCTNAGKIDTSPWLP